jgi:hypothetical protein
VVQALQGELAGVAADVEQARRVLTKHDGHDMREGIVGVEWSKARQL